MTLNGVVTVILRYFSEFGYLPGTLRKSSRSLSHLLMSSCLLHRVYLLPNSPRKLLFCVLWLKNVQILYLEWLSQKCTDFGERELIWVHEFTFAICCRPSVVRRLPVCNVSAPYSAGWNFRQCFYAIWYLGHPLTSTENFTEIVPKEPLRREG